MALIEQRDARRDTRHVISNEFPAIPKKLYIYWNHATRVTYRVTHRAGLREPLVVDKSGISYRLVLAVSTKVYNLSLHSS